MTTPDPNDGTAPSGRDGLGDRDTAEKPGLLRRILGSLLAMFACWFTFGVLVFVWLYIWDLLTHQPNRPPSNAWFAGPELMPVLLAFYFGPFIFGGLWLGAFLPVCLLVPRNATFWRWHICTTCGAVACAFLMSFVYDIISPDPFAIPMFVIATLTGEVTGLFMALTAGFFHLPKGYVEYSVREPPKWEY